MKRRTTRWLQLWVVVVALAGPAAAHDIWLQPDDHTPERGAVLIVRQLVGAELTSDLSASEDTQELSVLRDMTPSFQLITDTGTVDLLAELPSPRERPNVRPVVERTLDFEGMVLVTMDHAILYTEFTDEEFLEYLEHEGLEPERYREHMEAAEYQGEGYQRTLKSLVRVGGESVADSDLHARPVGQRIEILLRQNPYLLDPGDELEVRVLLHGEPLAGQVVNAYSAAGGSVSQQRAVTDAEGLATFQLDRAGAWLVRLVHLAPCAPRSGVDCEDTAWASYWTAYSFAVD